MVSTRIVFICGLTLLISLTRAEGADAESANAAHADQLVIVHCLLPGQLRQLGTRTTYLSKRRPVKMTARDCEQRGGEYALADQAGARLKMWLPAAQQGDPQAQLMVGELFETAPAPEYTTARTWYERAAAQGEPQALIALGNLYERGLGVAADPAQALAYYRRAAGSSASQIRLDSPEASGSASLSKLGQLAAPSLAAPSISIVDPLLPTTRGLVKVTLTPAAPAKRIVGRVVAPAGLLSVTVNHADVHPSPTGVFTFPLGAPREYTVTAIDQLGQRSDLSFRLAALDDNSNMTQPSPPQLNLGSYHALLIGNSQYRHLPQLQTPSADVNRLATLLQDKYGFQTSVLENADRYQILSALNRLRENLTHDDNLLVYYAGHGELDNKNMRGHWLPVDAEPGSTANWISNVTITDLVNSISAKQVLLIADSCYAGTLTRSSITQLDAGMTEQERATWLELLAKKRARVVLSSGGLAPVLDMGGGAHSIFAKALIEVLQSNTELLPGRNLYHAVAARVAHSASQFEFEQIPAYAPIARAGHEAGDFFLQPRANRH